MSDFVDDAQLNVKAGDGGAGVVAFRRESHVPKGGPDGGDGGKGGDVWLRANRNVASLLAFRDHPHRKAKSGTHGSGKKKHGSAGVDLVIDVPEGTVARGFDGELLADLVADGDRWLAARGGRGGRGNARFLSNARRAPSFAEQGEYGEERWLKLELKLLADAALVGFPNAGKSTLISVVSAAKPKIADYPFTTLVPNLGVVRFHEHEFVLADIPGLIEGAADGKGLGHQFLRHVERARALVILLDLAPVDGRTPAEQEAVLLDELGRYQPDLLERPRVVVGTKTDVATHDFDGPKISAVTRDGLDELLGRIAAVVEEARATEGNAEPYVVLRPEEQGFNVVREGDALVARQRPDRGTRGRARRSHQSRSDGVRAAAVAPDGCRTRAQPRGCQRRRPRTDRWDRADLRRRHVSPAMIAVVKIGTSSITDERGDLDDGAILKLCGDLAAAHAAGHRVVLVLSGAIAAGMPALGFATRPTDIGTLQALAAVGQPRLIERLNAIFSTYDIVGGQVLLTPYDFVHRSQYLHARETLQRLLDLGVLPIVNENDTIADDEIRYGDNDLLAALVSHLLHADALVMLTDTAGLFTADPKQDEDASLIEEIVEVDAALERLAGGAGTARGSGGMASKLAAAKIAAWSGVRVVIAAASAVDVVVDALAGKPVGTAFAPRSQRLSSRKLWIAFAQGAQGRIVVDAGARTALVSSGRSLLAAGVRGTEGQFDADAAVEIVDERGSVFAKGLSRYSAVQLRSVAGRRTADLPEGLPHEVVHRDDLVVLP